MDKRQKVIKGLECCINEERAEPDCECCPYGEITGTCLNLYKLHGDALELLKAQEPCEDWISRKRLKDEIQYYIDEAGWSEEINQALGWCLEFIDNQRAVTWNDA